jgi:hypothetical protein
VKCEQPVTGKKIRVVSETESCLHFADIKVIGTPAQAKEKTLAELTGATMSSNFRRGSYEACT